MTEPNPYAPPAVTVDTRTSEAPLPAGVRRFRLDPSRYDRFQWVVFAMMLMFVVPIFGVLFGLLLWIGIAPSAVGTLGVISLVWVVFARFVRIRMARNSNLKSYELLVSQRAVRRNLGGWVSAEVLRPEVKRIVEVRTGLWIICEQPMRWLFVANAIEDFENARATFSEWAPIEKVTGWQAFVTARRGARLQGTRDDTFHTALAGDPSLMGELVMLRSISQTVGLDRPRSMILRVIVLWFALMFMFLAIWQFLSPASPR